MKKPVRITLNDVATRAGVSAITVSRALRTPKMVSEKNLAKITVAVAELGYVPNPAARALASGRTNVIGVIIPSVTNSVFSDVLRGIYETFAESAFDIQLANTRYSAKAEEDLIQVFLSQKPAGLIVAGVDQTNKARQLLEQTDVPVVQIMDISQTPIDRIIGFSHYEAARAATQHLSERGYERLAFLGARMDPRTQKRFNGFRDQAEALGSFDERLVLTTQSASTSQLGAALFAELLNRSPNLDAVFCNNDDLALGAVFECQRRGIRIGTDIGICGFNDLEFCAAAAPAITSVETFRHQQGVIAARSFLDKKANLPKVTDLGFALRARGSTLRNET